MPANREVVNFLGLHGNETSAGSAARCALRTSTATCRATAPRGCRGPSRRARHGDRLHAAEPARSRLRGSDAVPAQGGPVFLGARAPSSERPRAARCLNRPCGAPAWGPSLHNGRRVVLGTCGTTGWNVGPAGSGSSAVRRRAGRRPRTTRSPLRLPLGSVADLSNTPTPQRRSWSDGSPPRSDAAYADLRLTSGRERRSTAPRQSGDPSTEYGLLHIVCKASACGVDHCSRRRGGVAHVVTRSQDS